MMPKCAHAHSDWFADWSFVRLTRCFVPGPLLVDSEFELPPGPAAHVTRVLGLRAGASLRLFDGTGGEFDATLMESDRRGSVRVRVGTHHGIERESPLRITLLQCLVRSERMDWLVQKSVELGVNEILPVSSRHGVVQLDAAAAHRRHEHWTAIAAGACEQCGRNRVPRVHAIQRLGDACRLLETLQVPPQARLLLDPDAADSFTHCVRALAGPVPSARVALLVGPEGGLSEEELTLALRGGFQACRFGPRVLRAETAPLAALAGLQTLLGDLS